MWHPDRSNNCFYRMLAGVLLLLIYTGMASAEEAKLSASIQVKLVDKQFHLNCRIENTGTVSLFDVAPVLFVNNQRIRLPASPQLSAGATYQHIMQMDNPWSTRGNFLFPVNITYRNEEGVTGSFYAVADVAHEASASPKLVIAVPPNFLSDDESFDVDTFIRNAEDQAIDITLSLYPSGQVSRRFYQSAALTAGQSLELKTEVETELSLHKKEMLIIVDYEKQGYHYAQLTRTYFSEPPDYEWLSAFFSKSRLVYSLMSVLFLIALTIIFLDWRKRRLTRT
ncbi:MAG: hypothetical protein OEZ43_06270 [Gammaproteobacteria bacterium]|nr:hypothetical protein [Gammaproteobacteria bacterium]